MKPKLEIICFTDPFCSWCWATEPALHALRERYRGQLTIQFVQGGLIKDMGAFHDALNDITTPAEVLPHWRMVSERSGQPIDEQFWLEVDPHVSTWPACIAVKAAGLQGTEVGDRYLRRLRRAVLTERVQIDREAELVRLAGEIAGLDVEAFRRDLGGEAALQAFHEDLGFCASLGVTGFPTLLFRATEPGPDQPALLVGGHHSLETYEKILARIAPGLEPQAPRPVETLLAEYGPLTSKELSEILGRSLAEAERELGREAKAGRLAAVELRGGTLWRLPGAAA